MANDKTLSLKALRVNARMTQEEAAEKIGVSPSTLMNWEQGKTFPDVRQIKLIEALYDVGFADINFFCTENTV